MEDMTKRRLRNAPSTDRSIYRKDVEDDINATLATLADIDQVYVQYRMKLET